MPGARFQLPPLANTCLRQAIIPTYRLAPPPSSQLQPNDNAALPPTPFSTNPSSASRGSHLTGLSPDASGPPRPPGLVHCPQPHLRQRESNTLNPAPALPPPAPAPPPQRQAPPTDGSSHAASSAWEGSHRTWAPPPPRHSQKPVSLHRSCTEPIWLQLHSRWTSALRAVRATADAVCRDPTPPGPISLPAGSPSDAPHTVSA